MRRVARARLLLGVALLAAAVACEPPDPSQRYRSETYYFRVTSEPLPPYAREDIRYRVVVRDKESNQPIENGEGQLYAENRDGKRTYGALQPGPEVGTYYTTISYLTAGDWAVAIRFRRDSTAPIETVDWMQQVMPERTGTP